MIYMSETWSEVTCPKLGLLDVFFLRIATCVKKRKKETEEYYNSYVYEMMGTEGFKSVV